MQPTAKYLSTLNATPLVSNVFRFLPQPECFLAPIPCKPPPAVAACRCRSSSTLSARRPIPQGPVAWTAVRAALAGEPRSSAWNGNDGLIISMKPQPDFLAPRTEVLSFRPPIVHSAPSVRMAFPRQETRYHLCVRIISSPSRFRPFRRTYRWVSSPAGSPSLVIASTARRPACSARSIWSGWRLTPSARSASPRRTASRSAGRPATTSSTRASTWPRTSSTTRCTSACASISRRFPPTCCAPTPRSSCRRWPRRTPAACPAPRRSARPATRPASASKRRPRTAASSSARRIPSCGTRCRTNCSSAPPR